MGKIILFVILVSVGIYCVVTLSDKTQGENNSQILDTINSMPPANTENTEEEWNQPIPSPITLSDEILEASTAAIQTSKGEIVIELYVNDAPETIKNFKQKAVSEFYKNLTFHRVEDWVIQGGDPKGNGTGGGSMPVEFNPKPFVVGSVGVASRGDGKVQNDAQFFITKSDASWLNEQYTNFGIVVSGMDVVQQIEIGDKILGITLR